MNSFCLFGNHTYVKMLPGEEFKPECLNLIVKHLLRDRGPGCVAHSEGGHSRWNCLCDQVNLLFKYLQQYISRQDWSLQHFNLVSLIKQTGSSRPQTGYKLVAWKQFKIILLDQVECSLEPPYKIYCNSGVAPQSSGNVHGHQTARSGVQILARAEI